jgi:hypothetical protein
MAKACLHKAVKLPLGGRRCSCSSSAWVSRGTALPTGYRLERLVMALVFA